MTICWQLPERRSIRCRNRGTGSDMGNKRSRAVLVGLDAAVGAVGAAAMMSAATAPTARADDFTDILNGVEGNFAAGQTAFGGDDVTDGLQRTSPVWTTISCLLPIPSSWVRPRPLRANQSLVTLTFSFRRPQISQTR